MSKTIDQVIRKGGNDGTILFGMTIRKILRQSTLNVLTSATKIPATPLSERLSIIIMNNSANIVYLGNSSVTTSDGFPLYPRATIQFDIEDNIDVYGIASGSSEVRILEGS